jgi:hypothetical protein
VAAIRCVHVLRFLRILDYVRHVPRKCGWSTARKLALDVGSDVVGTWERGSEHVMTVCMCVHARLQEAGFQLLSDHDAGNKRTPAELLMVRESMEN